MAGQARHDVRCDMNEQMKFPAGTAFGSIGHPIRRKEDARLLTGKGRFTDDFSLDGQTYAAMVRSPHPHARIVAHRHRRGQGDARRARACSPAPTAWPTASSRSRTRAVPSTKFDMKLTAPGGGPVFVGPHMLLPADKARHVGEAVAMVVAETRAQAMDAAEAVEVEYEELPFVVHSEDALQARRAGGVGRDRRQRAGATRCSATRPRPTAPSRRPRMW